MTPKRISLCTSVALLAACGPTDFTETRDTEQAVLADTIYSRLRDVEGVFNVPATSEVIEVGTFNVATGVFTGKRSSTQVIRVGTKPRLITIPAVATINAVNAQLRFRLTNRGTASVLLYIDGQLHAFPSGASSLTVSVGKSTEADWRIRRGTTNVEDTIEIRRPNVIGAGAFTIAALPVSMVYEPPQFDGGLSYASASSSQSVGSSVGTADSTSRQSSRPGFVALTSMQNKLRFLKDKVGPSAGPVGIILTGLSGAIDGLGSIGVTNTEGTEATSSHTVDLLSSSSMSTPTSLGMGPGRGDRIIVLRDVKVMWVMLEGQVSLSVLDWSGRDAWSAQTLRDDLEAIEGGASVASTTSRIDADSLRALLAADPFVAGGQFATLPASRYEYLGLFQGDGPDYREASKTITTTDREATTTFQSKMTEYRSGWMSALGLGVGSTHTDVFTTKHSSTRQVSVGETVGAELYLVGTPEQPYRVHVYYDRVFGTFAAKGVGVTTVNPLPTLRLRRF